MKKQLLLALAVPMFALPALADDHGRLRDRGHHPGHENHWRGDIRSFHQHDFPRWRGGHWHHGRHGGHLGWWWVVGGLWYFYPTPVYPYPDPYQPPVVMVERPAPVVVAPAPAPAPVSTQYWYYCESAQAYYPYVSQCPGPWQKVPASPPPGVQ